MKSVPTYALYGELAPPSLPEQLHCESIPSRSRLHNWEIRPHRHDYFLQILYIRAGTGQARLEDRDVPLEAPCAVVVPARHVHGFQFSRDIDGFVVTAIQQSIPAEIVQAFAEPAYLALSAGSGAGRRIEWAFEALVSAVAGNDAWRIATIQAALTLTLAQLSQARSSHEALPDTASRAQRHVRRFRELAERRFREQRDLGYYAAQLSITATQLNRVCRAELGMSALAVINRRLLAEAERDLAYTGLSVKEISFTLGFSDAAYFSRFFHRHTGRTPSAYREAVHARFSDPPGVMPGALNAEPQRDDPVVPIAPQADAG